MQRGYPIRVERDGTPGQRGAYLVNEDCGWKDEKIPGAWRREQRYGREGT